MVLHEHGDEVVCIGQASHAWVSGQLARRWGNERFARPDPFDEVCLGAEQHDDLLAKLGEDPDRARRNQKLVWMLDFLSLAPLTGWVPDTIETPTAVGGSR